MEDAIRHDDRNDLDGSSRAGRFPTPASFFGSRVRSPCSNFRKQAWLFELSSAVFDARRQITIRFEIGFFRLAGVYCLPCLRLALLASTQEWREDSDIARHVVSSLLRPYAEWS